MTIHLVFIMGFLSFGLGFLILFLKYRSRVETYLNMRFQRNYFMTPLVFFHKGKNKKGKHDSVLLVSALVLMVLGISTMLRVNAMYNAELELQAPETKAGHPLDSREIRGQPAAPPESDL